MEITAPYREVMTEFANLRTKLAEAQKELFEPNGRHSEVFIRSTEKGFNLFNQILNENELRFITTTHEENDNFELVFNQLVFFNEEVVDLIELMRSS